MKHILFQTGDYNNCDDYKISLVFLVFILKSKILK